MAELPGRWSVLLLDQEIDETYHANPQKIAKRTFARMPSGAPMTPAFSVISPETLDALRAQAGGAESPREVARTLIEVLRRSRLELADIPLEEVKAALFAGLQAAHLA
jgi:hypothetical protein